MQALLQAYEDMPPVTRIYTTACVLTTLAVVSIWIIDWNFLLIEHFLMKKFPLLVLKSTRIPHFWLYLFITKFLHLFLILNPFSLYFNILYTFVFHFMASIWFQFVNVAFSKRTSRFWLWVQKKPCYNV